MSLPNLADGAGPGNRSGLTSDPETKIVRVRAQRVQECVVDLDDLEEGDDPLAVGLEVAVEWNDWDTVHTSAEFE